MTRFCRSILKTIRDNSKVFTGTEYYTTPVLHSGRVWSKRGAGQHLARAFGLLSTGLNALTV